MAPTWPANLPQYPLSDGFQETMPQLSLRTPMDAGPAKVRRRFSEGVTRWSVSYPFTEAQRLAFWVFWKDEIEGGSAPYNYPDPRTGDVLLVRIVGEPTFSPNARGTRWTGAMQIEILP